MLEFEGGEAVFQENSDLEFFKADPSSISG
jgi:hypothetical protein